MRAVPAIAPSFGVDTLATITGADASTLRGAGFRFRGGYLHAVTAAELATQLSADLAFIPFTYAEAFDGVDAVARAKGLALPPDTTIFLDCEGASAIAPADLVAKINAWAAYVTGAGFRAGLYVGAGCPLTSAELSALPQIHCYMQGCSRLVDRVGVPQMPERGFAIVQARPPNVNLYGVRVDADLLQQDYFGDVPTWVVAA